MNWVGFQIKINAVIAPQSAHGPSIAVGNGFGKGIIYMAYADKGGTGLFTATCDANSGNFANWQGNVQAVSESGIIFKIRDRPTTEFYPNSQVVVYVDYATQQLFETNYFQNRWIDPVAVGNFAFVNPFGWKQPIIKAAGLKLYLLSVDQSGNPWLSHKTFLVDPSKSGFGGVTLWTDAQKILRPAAIVAEQREVTSWDLCQAEQTMVLLGLSPQHIYVYTQPLRPEPANQPWGFAGKIPLPADQQVNRCLKAISSSPSVSMISTIKGDNLGVADLQFHPVPKIGSFHALGQANQFASRDLVGGAFYSVQNGQKPELILAYKGEGSSNLYLAHGRFNP